ncbi:glycosyltransferase [Candidatus Parcubacteria bacterium]|nr:glycosyltransferase [Candidatus Parcubacteria bacterium]
MSKIKLALIGSYPPPYGGIAIHIQRLKRQLEEKEYECIVYDLKGQNELIKENIICIKNVKRWLLRYFFFARENIIHYHNSDWKMRVVIGLMGLLGKKTIISIQGASLEDSLKLASWFKKKIIILALKHTSFVIAANKETENLLLSSNIHSQKITVIPAFIPPVIKKEDYQEIPNQMWNFIKVHYPIISANAFKINFYHNQDLYGIDMCIDLCSHLKNTYPQIGFIFCLPNIGDYNYFHKMKHRIIEMGIENNFLFQTKPYQMYPIIIKSDLFVRPTNSDGDAVSLREALYFKIPSIASNIVLRPEGTILFKNRDMNDFTLKVKDALDNYEKYKERLKTVKIEDNSEKILKIYRKVINPKNNEY